MSKGLEALEKIGGCYVASEGNDLMSSQNYGNDYDIIEKHLKAFEIMKKHLGAPFDCLKYYVTARDWNEEYGDNYPLTDDEFDLLVEVIDDEQCCKS